jgi:exonuclease SbcC
MRLQKLTLQNIRSYKDEEIIFPDGKLLLAGDIGSGKTSILMAIEYALFGLQPGQKGSGLLRNEADEGSVSLEMEIDGQQILIERRLKRTPKTISNEYAAITINGEKNEAAVTEIKAKIIELLGYPPEFVKKQNILYRYTVYTPQEQMKQIIHEDPETRLNILRHMFGIEKYKKMRENITILGNYLKEETKRQQGEISSLDQEKERSKHITQQQVALHGKITEEETHLRQQQARRKLTEEARRDAEAQQQHRVSIEKEQEKTILLVSTKEEQVVLLKQEQQRLQERLEQARTFPNQHYQALLEKIQLLQQELKHARENAAEVTGQLTTITNQQKEQRTKKERIFKIDICPTCLQDVSDTHKHNILLETERSLGQTQQHQDQLEKQHLEQETRIKHLEQDLTTLEQQRLPLEVQRSQLATLDITQKKALELENTLDQQKDEITSLKRRQIELQETLQASEHLSSLLETKQAAVKEARKYEQAQEIAVAELKKEAQLQREEFQRLGEKIRHQEEIKIERTRYLELIDWLNTHLLQLITTIERNILLKVRREFSERCNRWFQMLATESLEVRLDETFSPIIMQGDIEMDYAFLSGGERTAVALAYRLALHQTISAMLHTIKTADLLILDEPTDGFSEAQIEKISDVLQELHTTQLLIVSHEPKIETFVDHVIRISKEDSASNLILTEQQTPPQSLNTPSNSDNQVSVH